MDSLLLADILNLLPVCVLLLSSSWPPHAPSTAILMLRVQHFYTSFLCLNRGSKTLSVDFLRNYPDFLERNVQSI
jgi:hypothetical protein